MSNIDDFLKQIKENAPDNIMVWIPSAAKEVPFRPISVAQQKEIIKSSLGGVKGNILLSKVFNDIILQNCREKVDIYLSDRSAILVALRVASLGRTCKDDKGKIVDIMPIQYLIPPIDYTVKDGTIEIKVQSPTLQRDSQYHTYVSNQDFGGAGDVVNQMYVAEVAKFITNITVGAVTLDALSVADSIKIVEELPVSINTMILAIIKKVKEADAQATTAVSGNQIILNAGFFNDPV